jgi:transposase-like protein
MCRHFRLTSLWSCSSLQRYVFDGWQQISYFTDRELLVFPAQRRARLNDAPHHKIIESLKFDISSTMEALEAALASLELSDSVNYAQTAREYGVDPTTLRRRHKGKQVSRHQAAFESKSLLTETQEQVLISHIKRLSERVIPPTSQMVRNFAVEIGKERPGKNWVYEFNRRHTDELDLRYLKGFDFNRKHADRLKSYQAWFQLISKLYLCPPFQEIHRFNRGLRLI